jgi:hypothetical protein
MLLRDCADIFQACLRLVAADEPTARCGSALQRTDILFLITLYKCMLLRGCAYMFQACLRLVAADEPAARCGSALQRTEFYS